MVIEGWYEWPVAIRGQCNWQMIGLIRQWAMFIPEPIWFKSPSPPHFGWFISKTPSSHPSSSSSMVAMPPWLSVDVQDLSFSPKNPSYALLPLFEEFLALFATGILYIGQAPLLLPLIGESLLPCCFQWLRMLPPRQQEAILLSFFLHHFSYEND